MPFSEVNEVDAADQPFIEDREEFPNGTVRIYQVRNGKETTRVIDADGSEFVNIVDLKSMCRDSLGVALLQTRTVDSD